eukprot:52016_1
MGNTLNRSAKKKKPLHQVLSKHNEQTLCIGYLRTYFKKLVCNDIIYLLTDFYESSIQFTIPSHITNPQTLESNPFIIRNFDNKIIFVLKTVNSNTDYYEILIDSFAKLDTIATINYKISCVITLFSNQCMYNSLLFKKHYIIDPNDSA